MAATTLRGAIPWVPVGVAAGLGALIVGLVLLGTGTTPVQAAPPVPQNLACAKDKDTLLFFVHLPGTPQPAKGTLKVELIGPDKKLLDFSEREVTPGKEATGHTFTLALPKDNLDQITVRASFDGKSYESTLGALMLVKKHETALSTSSELHAGTSTTLRATVSGARSVVETVPLPGSDVEVTLTNGKDLTHVLSKGLTGNDGVAVLELPVPQWPTGSYKLKIVTRSAFGEEPIVKDVQLKNSSRVLLVSDKPLYQPGQTIHLRALSLNSMSLAPVATQDLTFEIEDARGNKVGKKTLKTSEHGIAAYSFELASEVNQGDYQIRAILGDTTATKTVAVKPYVLPKFKTALKADKTYYLPKETLKGSLQVDYFFGKPVAGGEVEIKAATFDVAFKDFQTFKGKTDENGKVEFEIQLPDYFVGQPLDKGNAIVKLEARVTDTAKHSETITKTYPVSNQAIRLSLIPEGGRLTPGVENRVFAAAIYPDGSPAVARVDLWKGKEKGKGLPLKSLQTNEAGLAEFRFTPAAADLRPGQWGQRKVDMLGGQQIDVWGPQNLLDLFAEAKDEKGNKATALSALNSEPLGVNVLLRLNKAIYKGGESVEIDVRTSAGMPTVYLDIVREGQTLLTKWLDVKDGAAQHKLDLPPAVFGSLEVHAYQLLASGEILRDSRVIYVNPASELKINVSADQKEYRPGSKGVLNFEVVDAVGKPTAAALGLVIVDEAVYALQEMQPGLEKVYFTLQKELMEPKVSQGYKPSEGLDVMIRQNELPPGKQLAAEVLLTGIRPPLPKRIEVDPAVDRRRAMDQKAQQLGQAVMNYAINTPGAIKIEKGQLVVAADALEKAVAQWWGGQPNKEILTDPLGGTLTLAKLAKIEPSFTAENLGKTITQHRMNNIAGFVVQHGQQNQAKYLKDKVWTLPDSFLAESLKPFNQQVPEDAWGNKVKLVKREKEEVNSPWGGVLAQYNLVSAGPDGKIGTADDVVLDFNFLNQGVRWGRHRHLELAERGDLALRDGMEIQQAGGMPFGPGGPRFGGGFPGGFPVPAMAPGAGLGGAGGPPRAVPDANAPQVGNGAGLGADDKAGNAAAAPVKMREYFPETMLWHPALITDENGKASLDLSFADSITTWRLTASASSKSGLLGGTTTGLRVFQDFFVDLDLPINLTASDEVSFPVAIYNYLKKPQTVTLELEPAPWFELLDNSGFKRKIELKEGEVTSISFRIRAFKIGKGTLTVKATGTSLSDAIKREIDVVPNGKRTEFVATDRLTGNIKQKVTIPEHAIPDASKLFVKVYPGVMSQVLEGTDALLRMPGGCFEQTSSSAYPNILVVDYLRRTKQGSPEVMMKAEQYLSAGYQRLLTFERPGGGFDWWGSGEPLIWLSAYGLQEFNDMSKVYPIDKGIINRTQAWLMKQRGEDGTWSKIGATHGESIERMGDAKLLLTSYVCWALLDSGLKDPALAKSIAFIREKAEKEESAYILALAANALAAWDAKDDSTHAVVSKLLRKLDSKKEEKQEWKAICFPPPAGGQGLSYARGDFLTTETTALAVLAMIKSGEFTESVNKGVTYLIKQKSSSGHWGSTQATILALKALVAAAGGKQHKGTTPFTILVDGKPVADGKVTEENADVLQFFDLTSSLKAPGETEVSIEVKGETSLMYQIVGRWHEAWPTKFETAPMFDVSVDYDRKELSTKDKLTATAKVKYNGQAATSMTMLELGVPPGFTVDAGEFAEMVAAKKVNKFSVTARQIILYLGDMTPGQEQSFTYTLKPKYPVKAKTPVSVAYEYYTPTNRGAANPTEITVTDKK
jgi:hypothetical protein